MDFEDAVAPARESDELNKTTTKKKVHFESDVEECSYQVKILMTKEEAVRLLSKCKDGNVLDLKDVAHQLAGTTHSHTKKHR